MLRRKFLQLLGGQPAYGLMIANISEIMAFRGAVTMIPHDNPGRGYIGHAQIVIEMPYAVKVVQALKPRTYFIQTAHCFHSVSIPLSSLRYAIDGPTPI